MTQTAQPLPHESDILSQMRELFDDERPKWRRRVTVKFEIIIGVDDAEVKCVALQSRRVKFRQ